MKFKKPVAAKELFEFIGPLGSEILGDPDTKVEFFSNLETQEDPSFSFVINEKFLDKAEKSKAQVLLGPAKLKDKIKSSEKTWILSPNPELATREIKKQFVFTTPYRDAFIGVHPTATVHESVELGNNVTVGPHAYIAAHVKIGDNSFIGASAVIEAHCLLKNNVTIHPQAYVGHSCEIGNDCEVMPQAVVGSEGFGYAHDHLGNHYRIPHTGRVILQDDVHIGAASTIDRGTIEDTNIGQGTKIDNLVHLAHNTVIGKNGLVTAHVVVAGSTTIGDNFMCGGNSAINGHITITDNVHVGGFSAASNSVHKPGKYGGYPLQPLRSYLKTQASTVHLPEMRKQMNKILRKLFPEDYS